MKEKLANACGMPKDVVLGAPLLTVTGRNELYIGNYRGIVEYTDLVIRIQTKTGQIKVNGKRLQVEYYTNEEMKVTGLLCSIEFAEGREEP